MLSLLLLVFSAGIIAASLLPALPPLVPVVFLSIFSLCWFLRYRVAKILAIFILGLVFGIFRGYLLLDQIIDESYRGVDILVTGAVTGLPVIDERRQRFVLNVERAERIEGVIDPSDFPSRIQLTWFDYSNIVVSGEHWQFLVRLKPPRGFVNPGGFDYQGWLLRRQIGAVGTVRKHTLNERLAESSMYDVSYWRYRIREHLTSQTENAGRGIALALIIGDRTLITREQWQSLQKTGTSHLIAISGMHVSFVAVLGFFIGMSIGRLLVLFITRVSPVFTGCLCSLSFALLYAVLAGLSLPTRRAIIMVAVAQLLVFYRRSFRTRDALLLAWVLVLIADPLAAFDAGLWLSFGAVSILLLTFVGRVPDRRFHFPGKQLVRAQLAIFVGLMVPLVLMLYSVSLTAPFANLVAIPLVTLWVVPCLLLSTVFDSVFPLFSDLLLRAGLLGIDCLLWWADSLLKMYPEYLNPVISFTPLQSTLALVAGLLFLLPKGIPGRWLSLPVIGFAIVLPVSIPQPLTITFLDVGQGLAVAVRTETKTLVYDTGPEFSENFDAGRAIVIPWLKRAGIRYLDALVISHNDNDHAGGLTGVLESIPVNELLMGDPRGFSDDKVAVSCHEKAPWQWDDIEFSFLAIDINPDTSSNNTSCILLIRYGNSTVLLPGDAEREVEQQLLTGSALPSSITVLSAGHHGSRTSSSLPFVRHVNPKIVIYSAGFKSRYGHPHLEVTARFDAVNSQPYNTATSGAIELAIDDRGNVEVIEYRNNTKRYWYRD